MIKVQVRPNEPLEAALRRFKRQCNFAGIFRLAKKHSFFEKRSDTNRREERERVRTRQRAARKLSPGRSMTKRKTKPRSRSRPDRGEPLQTAFADTGKPREKMTLDKVASAAAASASSASAPVTPPPAATTPPPAPVTPAPAPDSASEA